MVKDKGKQIIEARRRLAQQVPDPTIVLVGSLMKRMIRCNKPGCRYCEKDKGNLLVQTPIISAYCLRAQ